MSRSLELGRALLGQSASHPAWQAVGFLLFLLILAVWNWSFRIAGVLHCDSAIIDALSVIILGMSFYPAGKVTEKEEAAA